MSESLPTEIWVQILAHLPCASLHLIKRVDRTLYKLCRDILCSVLDMTMNVKNHDGDELEILTKRLQDAKKHPLLIKKLRLSPTRVNIRESENFSPPSAQLELKSLPFRKRLFQKKKKLVQLTPEVPPRLYIRQALDKAKHIETEIASLIPLLSSLRELDFHQLSGWEGGWYSNFNIALKMASAHLTVLSLRFSLVNGPSGTIYALPALHTLRLDLNITPPTDFESSIRKLIAASSLLRELDYLVKEDTYSLSVPSHATQHSPTHSHFKVFKWTAGLLIPISPLFTAHASQFEVVHLNPVPYPDAVQHLSVDLLIELRVDLNCSSNAAWFFQLLAHATQLVTLEITGWAFVSPVHNSANLLLQMNLIQLRLLYLGIPLWLLSPEILGSLASRTPNLVTLAVLAEPRKGYCRSRTNLWKLHDFGIAVLEPGNVGVSPILPLIPLLRVILTKIPSITSFYGTGSLDLWEGMQSEIDESWGGELWRQRHGKR
ncbi:hypothetical protein DL96DRAFT_1686455 [Flagelloscypha sp. PMI_526]|nr:hypothetical protein DL96DRAFT_1686455 [Flagelloscypha sp. PMI_526]